MFNPLQKVAGWGQDLNQLAQKGLQLQQALAKQVIKISEDGVEIEMSGDQKVLSLKTDGVPQDRLVRALNKAIEESQKQAAGKLRELV